MGFALEPSVSLQREVKRVARERLDKALLRLENLDECGPVEIEDAVHDVRKRCKEVRALARLVRAPIGDEFDRFNELVRNAADGLSSIRDAHAVLATFDDLRATRSVGEDPDLAVIRASQAAAADVATLGIRQGDPRIRHAEKRLTAARRRVRRWKVPDDTRVLTVGIERTYERGRRGMRRARKRPTDERMHEWRKRVKSLWYQVRLVERSAPSILNPLVAQLDDLAEALGDDHDLSVLIDRLEADPRSYGGRKRVKRAVRFARAQQDDLRRRAFRLGSTLYSEKADRFSARVGTYWNVTADEGPELPTGGIAELMADERGGSAASASPSAPPARSVERERKFLVADIPELPAYGTVLRQGYLAIDGLVSLRVRDAGSGGCTLTVKAGHGAVRMELEWPISTTQFEAAWEQTGERRIHKTRYRLPLEDNGGSTIVELDVFHDDLEGLVLAEVEFETDAAMTSFVSPEWLGREVTDDIGYTNAALAIDPRIGDARA